MAAGHLVKALLRATSGNPYIASAINDPVDIRTPAAILEYNFKLPVNSSFVDILITVVGILFLAAGVALSTRLAIKLNAQIGDGAKGLLVLPAFYGGIFIVMFLMWGLF